MFNNFKKISKGLCAVLVLSLASVGTAHAQLGDAGEILRGGADDANTLLRSYLTPFGEGFGANLNTGWFNQAKAHGTLGFDISVNAAVALVPSSDELFNVADLGLTQLEIASGSSPESPTISGDDASTTTLELNGTYQNPQTGQTEEITLTQFDLPGGVGYPYVPSPMFQATLGIIKDTDVTLRFVPETDISAIDASVGLFGFGVKHGLNQWLPGGKVLPVDISLQFGYTSFNANAGFDVEPETGGDIYNPFNESQWDGQGLDMETTATTINAIVGKKLPFISVYGGIGFESSTTSITTTGFYPITSVNPAYNPQDNSEQTRQKIIEDLEAPIDFEIEGSNNMRAFVGARLSIAILRISASYTLSNYSAANIGVGFGFR
ncbi:MAG: hypothetical protein RI564_09915 [Gracilimonas sp.]|jgi:hypothetical protein|nr:hypothetical protein [Gracilimonas sp.]